jgi:enoyl-CoA hydratase
MSCFSLTESNHIAHLVLNQPEAFNTMHPTFWRELDGVLTQIHKAGTARALVISSTGKHFSAGMALETFAGAITMDDQSPEGRAPIFDLLTDMQDTFTKVDMVTTCCIRYATTDAFFCIQEINIGMVADVGTLQRLPKLIPLAVVKELAYTGRRLPATKALDYGLVNAVFDSPEATLAAAMQCAAEIATKPPVAIWGTKQAIHYARDHSVDESLKQMGWLQGAIWSNQHVMEAVNAMKAKRPGQFAPLSPMTAFTNIGE